MLSLRKDDANEDAGVRKALLNSRRIMVFNMWVLVLPYPTPRDARMNDEQLFRQPKSILSTEHCCPYQFLFLTFTSTQAKLTRNLHRKYVYILSEGVLVNPQWLSLPTVAHRVDPHEIAVH